MDIKGDMGARQLIDANPGQVQTVEMHDPLCFFDVDTEQDFEKLQRKIHNRRD
jgi:CTP:molybdopterin cytidylyltransferase MocA